MNTEIGVTNITRLYYELLYIQMNEKAYNVNPINLDFT